MRFKLYRVEALHAINGHVGGKANPVGWAENSRNISKCDLFPDSQATNERNSH